MSTFNTLLGLVYSLVAPLPRDFGLFENVRSLQSFDDLVTVKDCNLAIDLIKNSQLHINENPKIKGFIEFGSSLYFIFPALEESFVVLLQHVEEQKKSILLKEAQEHTDTFLSIVQDAFNKISPSFDPDFLTTFSGVHLIYSPEFKEVMHNVIESNLENKNFITYVLEWVMVNQDRSLNT
jgi:hypothetical protein